MRRLCLTATLGLLCLAASGSARAYQVFVGPIPGQSYQVPAEYAGYAPGSVINYGGYSYILGGDGTMTYYQQPVYPAYTYYYPYHHWHHYYHHHRYQFYRGRW
jgi:hypothetical protein